MEQNTAGILPNMQAGFSADATPTLVTTSPALMPSYVTSKATGKRAPNSRYGFIDLRELRRIC